MTFQSIFENFQTLPNGTDAFKQLKNECEHAIKAAEAPLESCSLFLIYGFAKNYVLLYEDQAVTPEFSDKVKAQLSSYMHELNQALMTQESTLILATLNDISQKYFDSSRIF